MSTTINLLCVVGGIVFVFLALAYFLVQRMNSLARFLAVIRHHYTHGVASPVVGGGLLAYGWMRSRKG